jgi:hypothetical protein
MTKCDKGIVTAQSGIKNCAQCLHYNCESVRPFCSSMVREGAAGDIGTTLIAREREE